MTSPAVSPPRPDPDPYRDPIAVALVDLVVERGYVATDIGDVIARAQVSREEFDRRFAGKEDCALKVFEAFVADYKWRTESAYWFFDNWRDGLRSAAYETAEWIVENPNLIHFGAVDLLAAEGEVIRLRREEALEHGAALIDRGRAYAADPAAISEVTPVMAIGSITQLLVHRLQGDQEVAPLEIVPAMMYQAVRPYLGEEIAREELTMPQPPSWRVTLRD
jgi:AcrR family transcriptional regulator